MDERLYRFLVITAIVLTVGWVGWSAYDSFFAHSAPGDSDYLAANKRFEDGQYAQALAEYDAALRAAPAHVHALRGRARTLMQLGRYAEALETFDQAVAMAPEFAGTYANRGILHDRMGRYQQALADYEHALRLDPELTEGPNWLTRFLRLQPDKPPTIDARAAYLRQELAKPPAERVLRLPELDAQQRPYKK